MTQLQGSTDSRIPALRTSMSARVGSVYLWVKHTPQMRPSEGFTLSGLVP
jgi:hypothetical protein